MDNASSGSSGKPDVIARYRQRAEIELGRGDVWQCSSRRGPGKAAVVGGQDETSIADQQAAPLAAKQQALQKSGTEIWRSRRADFIRAHEAKRAVHTSDRAGFGIAKVA